MLKAKTVKKLRTLLGWNQAKLAKAINATQSMISRYENGENVTIWSAKKLIDLAKKHEIELELE